MTVEQILREIAAMPVPTRAFIAEKILEMLDVEEQIELSPEWLSTIRERLEEIDAGQVKMIHTSNSQFEIATD